MIIIGITGSVGTGKSETSNFFKKKKIPVFDSDLEVSLLYKNKEVLSIIKKNFPKAFKKNSLIKEELAKIVFKNKKKLKLLENIIYKYLRNRRFYWIRNQYRKRSRIVVFDVPLLYEKDNIKKYDKIIVTTCSEKIQKKRVLKRQGWDETRFLLTKEKQLEDREKKKFADIVIFSDRGKRYVYKKVYDILKNNYNKKRSSNKILSNFKI